MGKRGKEEKYNHKTMELRIHKWFAQFKTMGIIIKGKKEKLGHYFLLFPFPSKYCSPNPGIKKSNESEPILSIPC